MSTTCKVHLVLKNKTGLINVYQERLSFLSVTFLSKTLHACLCISGHVQSSVPVGVLYLISVEIFPTLGVYSLMSE